MNRLRSLNNPTATSYGFSAIWYPVLRQNKGKSFAQSEGKQLPFFQERTEGSNSRENTTTTKVKHFWHQRHLSEGLIQAVYTFASVRSFQMPKTSQDIRDTQWMFRLSIYYTHAESRKIKSLTIADQDKRCR